MAVETRKILDPEIKVSATCVRVPVFISHAEAINVEFESPLSLQGDADFPATHLQDSPAGGRLYVVVIHQQYARSHSQGPNQPLVYG